MPCHSTGYDKHSIHTPATQIHCKRGKVKGKIKKRKENATKRKEERFTRTSQAHDTRIDLTLTLDKASVTRTRHTSIHILKYVSIQALACYCIPGNIPSSH